MLRRGCALIVLIFAALFAAYFTFFTRYFEWPGNLFAAGLGALFAAVGIGGIGHIFWALRDTAAFARAGRREPPGDGRLVVAAGPIRPLGAPLTSPFRGQPCVAYDYEVFSYQSVTHGGSGTRGRSTSKACDMAGFAMASSAIDTPFGSVRLLGFPLLDEFPETHVDGPQGRERARQYAAAAPFEAMHGLGAAKMVSALDEALTDADGMVRKDFRLTDKEIPFDDRTLGERSVAVGQQVCALGRWDAAKRALVPAGATLNRLWPGTAADVRRKIVRDARSQAVIGIVMFALSHAGLAAAFYLSETRHAREPEARQASAIRLAVQDNDVAALERAVRRGANPNARDTFGDAVLLDVREPEMAAALVRLGADVNVRHTDDGDTPLIRAARMGIVELVKVFLAAQADVNLAMSSGATALSEAIRGEHDEVVALLRAAGARAPSDAIER